MPYEPRLPVLNHYAGEVITHCGGRLLWQQSLALQKVKEFFTLSSNQNEVALVSMPTGSGKTGVIACLPYYLADIRMAPESDDRRYLFNKPILVIAPGIDILNQLRQELTVWKYRDGQPPFLIRRDIVPGDRHADVLPNPFIIEGKSTLENEPYLKTAGIVIANAQKFLGGNWENDLSDNLFRLVIVDEAHHHPARTWRRIVEKFRNPNCPVVFFTATPYRTDRKPVLPLDSYINIAYHLSLRDAVEGRIIRQTQFEELTEVRPDPDDAFLQGPEVYTPAQKSEIKRMIPILERVHELLQQKRSAAPRVPHMAIAIAKDTSYANLLLELWRSRYSNQPAESYHSKNENDNPTIMGKLIRNELSLVIVVAKLLEGFDHPPISIAAITCRVQSQVRFVQFIGRAQRIYRQDGYNDTQFANIVSHIDYQQRQNYTNFETEALIPQTNNESIDES